MGVTDLSTINYIVTDYRKGSIEVEPIIDDTLPKLSKSAYDYYWDRLIQTMQNTLSPLIDTKLLRSKLLGRGELKL